MSTVLLPNKPWPENSSSTAVSKALVSQIADILDGAVKQKTKKIGSSKLEALVANIEDVEIMLLFSINGYSFNATKRKSQTIWTPCSISFIERNAVALTEIPELQKHYKVPVYCYERAFMKGYSLSQLTRPTIKSEFKVINFETIEVFELHVTSMYVTAKLTNAEEVAKQFRAFTNIYFEFYRLCADKCDREYLLQKK